MLSPGAARLRTSLPTLAAGCCARGAGPHSLVLSCAPLADLLCQRRSIDTSDTEAGLLGGQLYAVDQIHSLPGILGEEQVAVQVDVVAETRDLAGGRDCEARFDHAAQHDAEVERAGRVRDSYGFPDATGLGQLDVDAVGPLSGLADVLRRVDVLVDVDRERRLLPQLGSAGIPRGQGLFD